MSVDLLQNIAIIALALGLIAHSRTIKILAGGRRDR